MENDNAVPQGDLSLPNFISRRDDGVFIDLARLHQQGGLSAIVDRLFAAGYLFSELDYSTFLKLLYDADWLAETQKDFPELKLAQNIVYFTPQRKALYHAVKTSKQAAEYMFEPVSTEEHYREQLPSEPDENGVVPPAEFVEKVRQQPATLNFDEFVADMWAKGVKFGILEDEVRKAIHNNTTGRLTIAQQLEPGAGRHAEIIEVRPDLHCDNSPKILASGRADLTKRKNRFPQVKQDMPMLKKIPRQLGKQGRTIAGDAIEPDIPKDVNLNAMSGLGTYVKQLEDGEYLIATMDGFVNFDEHSNKLSVMEKIENQNGISVKTTGNLELGVDEFVEHGEVQEKCTVTGKHLTFMSDVFGKVVSEGGNIVIAGNLSGGTAQSDGGNITLSKRASCATARALDGEIHAEQCDNTLMIAKKIQVDHAINCQLIADEVSVNSAEGCLIAAKIIHIQSSNEKRNQETLVTLLIPDLSAFDSEINNLNKQIDELKTALKSKAQELASIKNNPDFAKFLSLYEQIKSGVIKLTTDQANNWRKLVEKNTKTFGMYNKLLNEGNEINQSVKELQAELGDTQQQRDEAGAEVCCTLDKIIGQTTVQSMKTDVCLLDFNDKTPQKIRELLQKVDSLKTKLFCSDTGSFIWHFKKTT